MPIPREQFDKGLGERERPIVQLLQSAPDKAFSFDDIANSVGVGLLDMLSRFSLVWTLNDLVKKGLIESKTLGGTTYYAVARSSGKG